MNDEARADELRAKAEALRALGDAISAIRQAGGDVHFDIENLRQLGRIADRSLVDEPEVVGGRDALKTRPGGDLHSAR